MIIVYSNDGHVCERNRSLAARLRDEGYRVLIAVEGMCR